MPVKTIIKPNSFFNKECLAILPGDKSDKLLYLRSYRLFANRPGYP
jgi:hypothetical protein